MPIKTPENLRLALWQWGAFLYVRHLLTAALGLITTTIAVTWLGFGPYGVFAGVLGLVGAIGAVSDLGVGGYLLRHPGKHDIDVYHQAFTLLCLLGLTATFGGIVTLPWIVEWVGISGFNEMLLAMLLSIPVVLLCRVPQCKLERELNYRPVAITELLASLARSGLVLGLIAAGWGVWGLVIGWWAFHLIVFVGFLGVSRYRPKFVWRWALLRPMLGLGLKSWSARSILALRDLVNPLIVGRALGSDAMGKVAIAISLCEVASMLLTVAQRLSGGLFGNIQGDRARVARAISEGTFIQVWLTGAALVGISWLGSFLFPPLLGPGWAQVMALFPYLAIYYLAGSLTQLHASAFYTYGRGLTMLGINSLYLFLFALLTYFFIPVFDVVAYGVGSALGALVILLLLPIAKKQFGHNEIGLSIISAMAFALAMFVPQLGPGAALGLVIVLMLKPIRKNIAGALSLLKPGKGRI